MRNPISTVTYRAEDLLEDDIAQLKLHGQARWVHICQSVQRSDKEQVALHYTNTLGTYSSIDMGRYELVRIQVEKEPS
jgi:hypothetical protein